MKPTLFEDLIALVALYRAGPEMQYIPFLAHRQTARSPSRFIDPRLKPITGMTYGITIYQQVHMKMAESSSPAHARRGR